MSTLTVTLIQTSLYWQDKNANLIMLENKINSIEQRTELVILPEMFSTGFSMQPHMFAEGMNGETLQWMKRIAKEKNIILCGSIIAEEENKYYNRLIWMLPDGRFGIYNKRHLFAFAGEHEHYSAGTKRLIGRVRDWKINMQVCYDLRFPVWARQQTADEYDVLIYVANWPEKRSLAWKTLLQARAIENQCYVIGVNRVGNDGNNIYHSGDSMIIDPAGEILYTKAHDEDVFTFSLNKDLLIETRERLPFLRDADKFGIYNA